VAERPKTPNTGKPSERLPKPRRRPPARSVSFSVYTANGGPLPEEIVQEIDEAIQGVILRRFNDGHRILTAVSRG
jgi:hypothetical protein